jgi:hypothetical protein
MAFIKYLVDMCSIGLGGLLINKLTSLLIVYRKKKGRRSIFCNSTVVEVSFFFFAENSSICKFMIGRDGLGNVTSALLFISL